MYTISSPVCTYQIRVTSIWGSYTLRRNPYYSARRALNALKLSLILNDSLHTSWEAGKVIFELIHYVDGLEVAKQFVEIKDTLSNG
jgi:hypothetical protein